MTRDTTTRRSRGGGYVIPASDLRVGDRLELISAGQPVFFPIIEINDTPKTRRVTINVGSLAWPQPQDCRVRKTTLVARGVRHGEAPPDTPVPDPAIQASFDATDLRVIDAAQADDDHEPTDDE